MNMISGFYVSLVSSAFTSCTNNILWKKFNRFEQREDRCFMHRTDSEQSSRCQIDAKSASIAEEQKQKEKSHVYISVNFIYRNVAYLAKKKITNWNRVEPSVLWLCEHVKRTETSPFCFHLRFREKSKSSYFWLKFQCAGFRCMAWQC